MIISMGTGTVQIVEPLYTHSDGLGTDVRNAGQLTTIIFVYKY